MEFKVGDTVKMQSNIFGANQHWLYGFVKECYETTSNFECYFVYIKKHDVVFTVEDEKN